MHRDRRYRVRNLRRNALRELGARFNLPQSDGELQAAVDDLIALHRKRWARKDHTKGAFRSRSYIGFHREAIERCHRNGWIRLYRMEAGGKAVAVLYCYRYRDEVLYFSRIRPAARRVFSRPVLMGFAIESAIGEGARVFDLLKVTTRTRAPGRTTFAVRSISSVQHFSTRTTQTSISSWGV